MIKKLQIKMVVAAMLSLFVVLTVIMGAVSFFSYRNIISDADVTLSLLVENDGSFPDSVFAQDNFQKNDYNFSVELPYQSRYFSVFYDSNLNVVSVNTGKIAAVDSETAVDYSNSALSNGREKGFEDDYRYIIYNIDNETHIVFLDCGNELNSFRTLILTAVGVCGVGLIAVLLLLVFSSGKIVKPFSENYEKQKRFITDAGHELKTPLTIIDADTEILEMDYGENEWLGDIKTQTTRLADLTNNLIMLSRMEEEQTKEEMIDFPLSDVAEETVETFKALAKTHNKNLSCEIEPMITMHGDEKAIRRFITILLDNAVKYSDDGGTISLTLEKQKNLIKLSVFNTADAVSKDDLTHLFDRFYRADSSRNSQTGGYGLGLSIASAIVNAHKGKISAKTHDEKSLLITATFPV